MKSLDFDTEEPICAIATPLAPSALGIVRFTGKNSLERFAPLFSRPEALRRTPHRSACFGRVRDPDGQDIDDVVVLVWREGGGYTGQEGADVIAHGNPVLLLAIVQALLRSGFRQAGPGEFTLRAFLNGKLDLTQAEAVHSLVSARTARAGQLALQRLHGSIRREIDEAKRLVLDQLSRINIQLDYDEADVESMSLDRAALVRTIQHLRTLAASASRGHFYRDGIRVALAGPVNAGKSSLFNRLLQEERSIVSAEAGTTRDFLEGWIDLEGVPLRLFDTAGLRATDNQVETEGIRRTLQLAEGSDLVLLVVDGATGVPSDLPQFDKPSLRIWNKIDVAPHPPPGWLGVSARTGEGWETLLEALRDRVRQMAGLRLEGEVSLDSVRQAELLERAVRSLEDALRAEELGLPHDMIALDLQDALDALGEITGEVTTDEVLKHMFGNFCVGK